MDASYGSFPFSTITLWTSVYGDPLPSTIHLTAHLEVKGMKKCNRKENTLMRTYAINNTRIFKARFKYCCIADLRTAFLHNPGSEWNGCSIVASLCSYRRCNGLAEKRFFLIFHPSILHDLSSRLVRCHPHLWNAFIMALKAIGRVTQKWRCINKHNQLIPMLLFLLTPHLVEENAKED